MEQQKRAILYHYTDFQTLNGILCCAHFLVNNILNMNDSAKMRHFMNRLEQAGRLGLLGVLPAPLLLHGI